MDKTYIVDDGVINSIRLPFFESNIPIASFIRVESAGLISLVEYGYELYGLPKVETLDIYVKIRLRVLDLIEKYER